MSEKTKAVQIGEINLPGLEVFKKIMSDEQFSHVGKSTKSYHVLQMREKSATVARFGRCYEVKFILNDDQIEINSIDGNSDVEETYNMKFIEHMEEGARWSMVKEGNHE